MECLYLTKIETDAVRGDYGTSRLEPVAHGAGFILGLEVLTDPAFEEQHELLASLPRINVEVEG